MAGHAGMNYVVTAHKPTAVTHSVMGHFTSANDLNLVVAYVARRREGPPDPPAQSSRRSSSRGISHRV